MFACDCGDWSRRQCLIVMIACVDRLLLQKQEREFEARLVEERRKRKQKEQRRGRQERGSEAPQSRQQGGCDNSGVDCTWVPSTFVVEGEAEAEGEGNEVGGSKVVESSESWAREPLTKTRRVEGRGGESEEEAVEANAEADEEEECPSCARACSLLLALFATVSVETLVLLVACGM